MGISHIPKGFNSVTPYFLVDDGDGFADFLKRAFDAEVIDHHKVEGRLLHGAYRIFGSIVESGEGGDEYPSREYTIHLYVPDCDAVYKKAIAAGGKALSELADQPYGERSGGITDPYGNQWYIATQLVDMYPEREG